MAQRYFKKSEPKNSPVLANGSKCEFTSLDHFIGFFATDNSFVQSEFERLMSEGRFGITEITAEEFVRDYLDKKKASGGRPLKPLWREEIIPRQTQTDTVFAPVLRKDAAAVDNAVVIPSAIPIPEVRPMPTGVPIADVQSLPASTTVPVEFKPTLAKRAKMRPTKNA